MKKLFVIAAVASFGLSMASCKKAYTCECEVNAAGITSTSTVTFTDTKKNAEKECEEAQASLETQHGSGTSGCSLAQ